MLMISKLSKEMHTEACEASCGLVHPEPDGRLVLLGKTTLEIELT